MDKVCRQIITAILITILIAVPLYLDARIYSVFDLSKITVLYLLVFALAVVFCVKRISNSSEGFVYSPLLIPIACYLVVAVIATCFSISPVISLLGGYKRYNGLLSLFVYVFMFFVIINYVEYQMVDIFINVIIIVGCITCAYGICQNYNIDFFRWNTDMGKRIFSTIGHPAFYSAYLIMILPLIYYKVIKCRSMYFLLLYLFCAVLILTTFYLTKTRASFIGLVVSNIFFFSMLGRIVFRVNRGKIIMLICLIIVLSVIFSLKDQTVFKRFSSDIDLKSEQKLRGTMFTRYYNALVAIEVIKDYPVFGLGFGNYVTVFQPYLRKVYIKTGETRLWTENQDRVHSRLLDILVTTGFMGLACYLFGVYSYIKMVYRSLHEHRLLIVALGSGIFAYFIQNQFSFPHVPILMLFWFMLGLSVITCRTGTLTRFSTYW